MLITQLSAPAPAAPAETPTVQTFTDPATPAVTPPASSSETETTSDHSTCNSFYLLRSRESKSQMSEDGAAAVLVAISRVETKLQAVDEKLAKLDAHTEKRLDEAELRVTVLEKENSELLTRVAVLEAAKPMKVSFWTVATAIVAIATIVILVFDRFYLN